MRVTAFLICAVLAGCAGTPQTRALTTFTITCDSYTSTLKVVTGFIRAGKLTPEQIEKAKSIRAIVTPVCMVENPSDPRALLAQIDKGVAELIAMKEGAR